VQAFTPILGTLLLSSNPLVGGSARYAVVHLLSRMKRADDVNTGDPTTPLYLSAENFQEDVEMEWLTGLFGRNERDMFRTEILQQVVIGMGRLDMDIDDQCDLDDLSREYQQQTSDEAGTVNGASREQSEMGKIKENDFVNPYFPLLVSPFSVVSPPRSAVSQASTSLSPSSLSSLDSPQPSIVEHTPRNHPDGDITLQDDWMPSAPRPSHRTLPPPRDSTPWSSPDMSDVAHLESSSDSTTDSRHFYLEEFGSYGAYNLHEGSQNSYLYGSEEGESDEQAAVGRLSSMSLIAAVAASGLFGVFIFLVPIPHLYRRLSW
jgi:serine/threonine-protein phosphatase 4 regulatory subunit 1